MVVVFIGLASLWLSRRPLTERAVHSYLVANAVEARYKISEATPDRLVFDDVVLGPVARPDLVAKRITVDLAWIGFGPTVSGVRFDSPVLRANVGTAGVSFGSLDRLIPTRRSDRLPPIAVVIAGGTAFVTTPLGLVAAQVDGNGRIDRDFRASVRTAPVLLRGASCSASVAPSTTTVTTNGNAIVAAGVGEFSAITCPAVSVPQSTWSFRLAAPVSFDTFSATFEGQAPAGQIAQVQFLAPALFHVDGMGTSRKFSGKWTIAGSRLVAAGNAAASVAAGGAFRWVRATGLGADGSLAAKGVVSRTARTALAARGLPGIAARLTAKLAAVSRSVDIDLRFSALLGAQPEIRVMSVDVRGGEGATLRFAAGKGATWSAAKSSVDGTARLFGGGLPTASVQFMNLTTGPEGWTGAGTLVVAPWRSGRDAITVPEATFKLAPGTGVLSGRAIVSTSFGAGRVEGLDMRLALSSSQRGDRLSVGPGCADIAAKQVSYATLTLAPFVVRLCPSANAPLLALNGRKIAGRVNAGAVDLHGDASGRAFTIKSRPARIVVLGTLDRPVLRTDGMTFRIGSADFGGAATASGVLAGTRNGWTGSGRIANAEVDVPAVLARKIAARWQLTGQVMTLADARADVTDRSATPRFAPLVVNDGGASLSTDRFAGHATIRLADGLAPLATVMSSYLPGSGTGSIQVDSTLSFSKQLQPLQISELARGLVANVDGTVVSHADLVIAKGAVSGAGIVQFKSLSLATAALGPISGIDGTLHFDDLPSLHTLPAQQLTIAAINPGVLVEAGVATFQIIDATTVAIDRIRWPFAGGTLTLQPVTVRVGDTGRSYLLAVDGLDAGLFLQRFDLKNLNVTGTFDGTLPLVFDGSVGRIEGGILTARAGGGTVQYVGDVGQDNMGAAARLAFDALRRLRYRTLSLSLDGDLDGELVTAVNFSGISEAPVKLANGLPASPGGLPFKFKVTVRAPFRALLGTVASFGDARSLLHSAKPTP